MGKKLQSNNVSKQFMKPSTILEPLKNRYTLDKWEYHELLFFLKSRRSVAAAYELLPPKTLKSLVSWITKTNSMPREASGENPEGHMKPEPLLVWFGPSSRESMELHWFTLAEELALWSSGKKITVINFVPVGICVGSIATACWRKIIFKWKLIFFFRALSH